MGRTHKTTFNTGFYLHLFVTSLAWLGPFLFNWKWMWAAYAVVHLQYIMYNKCLMNASHGLDESVDPDDTFYGQLFDMAGIKHNKKNLKKFARGPLYPILGLFAFFWQYILGISSLIF